MRIFLHSVAAVIYFCLSFGAACWAGMTENYLSGAFLFVCFLVGGLYCTLEILDWMHE